MNITTALRSFVVAMLWGAALGAPAVHAACSTYQGKVVFNEVFDKSGPGGTSLGFVEVKILDPGLAAATSNFSNWSVAVYKKTGTAATTVNTTNFGTQFTTPANNTCGQQSPWIRIPDSALGNRISGSNPNSNLNFVLYESGKIVDVLRLGAATTLYTPGTSYATCPAIESNIATANHSEVWGINGNKDWFRTPDGTGTWTGVDTANNNTGCGSNQGGGAFGVSKVASATNVPINTNFTFTLYAQNGATGGNLTGVTITDDLTAAGLAFASCTTASGTCIYSGGTVIWSVGAVAAGTTKSATLTVSAPSAGAKTNTITSNIGTPVATASATVQAYAPLADWHLDETSWSGVANEVKDSSGNGYHGKGARAAGATVVASTASGTPAYTSGSQTTCGYGDFDRASGPTRTYSYVELTGIPPLPSSFTFAAWIRSTNASQSGQRILVRDDADDGWGFSLGDPGSAKIRFFNRKITNSGAVTGDGTNPGCGVFCLDTAAVITNNAWFFVAVAIDTTGKTVTHYVYNAAGTLVSNTSTSFTGTWVDGTGTASIGGETVASPEGTQSSFHFLGNIDELQIYSGVLGQAELNVLRTRSRNCSGSAVDHYELSLPTASLTCLPSTVTVTACTNSSSPCTSAATSLNGQTAVLTTSGATLGTGTVTFNGSGVATTTLSYPLAADGTAVSVTLSGEQTSATNLRQCCPNGTSCAVGNVCNSTFNTAGLIVSSTVGGNAATIPTQTAGTSSLGYYLRAIKTSTTTQACEAALSGTQNVDWAYKCNNPTTCTASNLLAISGGASTVIQRNDNSSALAYLPVSMEFDANGNAPFTFNYSDVGQVTLHAKTTANGATLSGSSNAFVVKPGGFVLSDIKQTASPYTVNPAAVDASGGKFVKAGEDFTATVTATTSGGATTPNFGREIVPEGVLLTRTLVAPVGAVAGALANGSIAGGSFSAGVATVNNLTWSEVGIMSLTPSVADGDYLGAGPATGTVVPYVGRFVPDHFVVTSGTLLNRQAAACPATALSSFSYAGEALQVSNLQLTARNGLASPSVTVNYQGAFARFDGNTPANFAWGAVDLADADAPLTAQAFAVGTGAGQLEAVSSTGSWTNGIGTFSANLRFNRTTAPDGPFESVRIGMAPTDPDGVAVRAADRNLDISVPADSVNDKALVGSTKVRWGRARLQNMYGSEYLPLGVPVQAEFWQPSGFVANTDDSCTPLAFPAARTLGVGVSPNGLVNSYFYPVGGKNQLAAADTTRAVTTAGGASTTRLGSGKALLAMSKPGKVGWLDILLDVPDYLRFNWGNCLGQAGTAGLQDDYPCARATFGVYKSPVIYRRENY